MQIDLALSYYHFSRFLNFNIQLGHSVIYLFFQYLGQAGSVILKILKFILSNMN
jgi:hypothetical protein